MTDFKNFNLKNEILNAIDELNYQTPTEIQEKSIPFLLNNHNDYIGLAQTGTGKTAAFGLPILQNINTNNSEIQCLILAPTRELCLQITKDLTNYSKYIDGLRIVPIYGGASIEMQLREIKQGVHIVVGTPGRILDLSKRSYFNLDRIKYLVLDEADEMLNMGFKDDLDAILSKTPKGKQTLLFSATMPNEIRKIAENYMNNPTEISVGEKNAGAENVKHFFYVVNARDRYLALKRVVDMYPKIYGIVFCRTRKETQEIAEKLIQDGYDADSLHGDLSQQQREHVMGKFRSQHLQILVATDVAARGLDVNNLSHIINYNLPDENEIYIHRSGRTGRAGKSGISISIIHSKELSKIKSIEKLLKRDVVLQKIPSGKEICRIQLMSMIDKIEQIETNEEQIEDFLPLIMKKLDWLSREDLIKRFVSLEFNRFLMYYQNSKDINVDIKRKGNNSDDDFQDDRRRSRRNDDNGRGSSRDSGRGNTRGEGRDKGRVEGRDKGRGEGRKGKSGDKMLFSKYFLSIGEKDGFTKSKLLELINSRDDLAGVEVGKIEILKTHCFFELDSRYDETTMKAFKNRRYDGVRLKIERKNN